MSGPDLVERLERELRENLASFDAEVAYELDNEGERADLWTDIDVPVESIRALLAELSTLRSRCETLERELATVTETLSLKFFAAQTELISANERVHYAEGTASANIDRANEAESARDEAVRALEPFAAIARDVAENHPGWDRDAFEFALLAYTITLAPFRAARALTQPSGKEKTK